MLPFLLKLGGIQGILMGLLLLGKRPMKNDSKVLLLLLVLTGVSCIWAGFESTDLYIQYPALIRVNWGIPLLFGPLVYVYVLYNINHGFQFKPEMLWFFAPYLINLMILFPFFLKDSEYKLQVLDYFTAVPTKGSDHYEKYYYILHVYIGVQSLYFLYTSHLAFRNRIKLLKEEFADISQHKKEWLQIIIYGFFGVFIIYLITTFISIYDLYPSINYTQFLYLAFFVLIYVITFKVLSGNAVLEKDIILSPGKSPSRKSDLLGIAQRVRDRMEVERSYLNPKLTASQLANELEISRHELSEVLNKHFGKNFYDFVNEYRIQMFKVKLKEDSNAHLSILGIALESGFNSKTTFNTVFKASEGITPSEYKRKMSRK